MSHQRFSSFLLKKIFIKRRFRWICPLMFNRQNHINMYNDDNSSDQTQTFTISCDELVSLVHASPVWGGGGAASDPPATRVRHNLPHRGIDDEEGRVSGWGLRCACVRDWSCDIISALINCRNEASHHCTGAREEDKSSRVWPLTWWTRSPLRWPLHSAGSSLSVAPSTCRLGWRGCCSWVPHAFSAQVGEPSHLQLNVPSQLSFIFTFQLELLAFFPLYNPETRHKISLFFKENKWKRTF